MASIYDQEMRRRKINEALMQQAFQSNRVGQTSGRVVPYGYGEGFTQLGKALIAKRSMDKSDTLEEKEKKRREEAVQKVLSTYRGAPAGEGTPAVTAPLLGPDEFPAGEQTITPEVPPTPAVAPDPEEALLMAATDPGLSENKALQSIIAAKMGRKVTPYSRAIPTTSGWMSHNVRTDQILHYKQMEKH